MRKRLSIAAAALSTLLLPAALLAGHAGGHSDHPAPPKAEAFFDHVSQVLSLTDSQKAELHDLLAARHAEIGTLVSRLRAGHEALRQAVHAPLSEAEVRGAARRLGEVHEEMAVLHARLVGDLRRVLDTEQLDKAHQMLSRLHGRCDGFLEHLEAHLTGK